jgi:hypothetical protein
MGDIVNLRTARKQAARLKANRKAEQQRRAHGRTKSERVLSAARDEKARRTLDQHRLGNGESE